MKRLLFILAFIGLINYSHGQPSYFPLNKGMKLTYAFSKEIYEGTPYEGYTTEVLILDGKEKIEGKEYFISESYTGKKVGDKTTITTYFRYGDDGSLISKPSKNETELLVMQKTPKIGQTQTSHQGGTSKVLDLNASIKTPIKTYTNCLLIETTDHQNISRTYYQKNIGMIATTIVSGGSEKMFIYLVNE